MSFGLEKVADRSRFYNLVTKTGRMDAYTTMLALRESYETHYGLFDHDNPVALKQHPLALVALHPKEDVFSYSLLHRYMWKFRQYEIQKYWGYNLSEFLELPWDTTQAIFRIEQKRAAEQNKIDQAEARNEKRMMEQGGH